MGNQKYQDADPYDSYAYDDEDEREGQPPQQVDRSGMGSLAVGTSLVSEAVVAMAHLGPLGVIGGIGAGALVWLYGPTLKTRSGQFAEDNNLHLPKLPKTQMKSPSGRTFSERILGRSRADNDLDGDTEERPGRTAPRNNDLPRRSPTFAQMRHLIKSNQDILGFDGKRFLSGQSFSQVVNIGVIGKPRNGKTTLLRFFVAQGIIRKSIIRGWDFHGDVASEFPAFAIWEDIDDIIADSQYITDTLQSRDALRKRFKKSRGEDLQAKAEWDALPEILYVIDEFLDLIMAIMSRRDDELTPQENKARNKADADRVTSAMLRLISAGAKYKMRCIVSGQAMPAALFGDMGSVTKDLFSVRYVLQSEPRQAQMMNLDNVTITNLLPIIAGDDCQGYTILDGGPLTQSILGSIPWTTADDIEDLIEEFGVVGSGNVETDDDDLYEDGNDAETDWKPDTGPRGDQSGNSGNNITPFPDDRKQPEKGISGSGNAETETDQLPLGVTEEMLTAIEETWKAGWNAREAAANVGIVPGRRWKIFMSACEYLGIDFREKA